MPTKNQPLYQVSVVHFRCMVMEYGEEMASSKYETGVGIFRDGILQGIINMKGQSVGIVWDYTINARAGSFTIPPSLVEMP